MGGCATKPKDVKGDVDAPLPTQAPEDAGEKQEEGPPEEKKEVVGGAVKGEEVAPVDENRRRSLGLLFKEDEKSEVPASTDKNIVAETIAEPTVKAEEVTEQLKTENEPSKEHEVSDEKAEISNLKTEHKPLEEQETGDEKAETSNPIQGEISVPSPEAVVTDEIQLPANSETKTEATQPVNEPEAVKEVNVDPGADVKHEVVGDREKKVEGA